MKFEFASFTLLPFKADNLTSNISIARDSIAETIRIFDTSFNMFSKVAVKIKEITEANSILIGIIDPRIVPIVVTITPILTNPINKVIIEYTLYGLWQVTPPSKNDTLLVKELNGNITVKQTHVNSEK